MVEFRICRMYHSYIPMCIKRTRRMYERYTRHVRKVYDILAWDETLFQHRHGYQLVGALADATVVNQSLVGVFRLVETAFGGYGSKGAVTLHPQILVGIIALLEWYGGVVCAIAGIVFHEILGEELVVGPLPIEINIAL